MCSGYTPELKSRWALLQMRIRFLHFQQRLHPCIPPLDPGSCSALWPEVATRQPARAAIEPRALSDLRRWPQRADLWRSSRGFDHQCSSAAVLMNRFRWPRYGSAETSWSGSSLTYLNTYTHMRECNKLFHLHDRNAAVKKKKSQVLGIFPLVFNAALLV